MITPPPKFVTVTWPLSGTNAPMDNWSSTCSRVGFVRKTISSDTVVGHTQRLSEKSLVQPRFSHDVSYDCKKFLTLLNHSTRKYVLVYSRTVLKMRFGSETPAALCTIATFPSMLIFAIGSQLLFVQNPRFISHVLQLHQGSSQRPKFIAEHLWLAVVDFTSSPSNLTELASARFDPLRQQPTVPASSLGLLQKYRPDIVLSITPFS
jgi:hypothetical protein